MIGSTIGRYRVVDMLGEGGMGAVWLAEDPVLGRSVALKLLPDRMADSPAAKERLLREARAACNLHHPGIATVYEAGEEDGRLWVAFEHVDGETVAQRVKREGPLPVEEAMRIARAAAAALDHAHASGILHRDVTAGNIMLDTSGRVKLVDFGLALPEEQSRRTRTMETPGTIGYVAPEVVKGERGDRRADLYGLGVVLYEMLTGHLPFERDRAEAVLYAVVNEGPVPPRQHRPDLPANLEAIVLRALAKDPAERFSDAEELARALETGVSAHRDEKDGRRRRLPRRAALVAGAVIAVAAIAYLLWPRPQHFDSVAVLPLSLPGENAEEIAYLATGLADALAGRLVNVAGLRVTPWVTSRRYPPGELPLPDIAAELDVESLVVGTFRQDEDGLHVALSLRAAGTGEPAWSAQFDETRTGLLELEDVISLAVASSARGNLTAEEESLLVRRPTERKDAYDQYLRGAAALQAGTRDATDEALGRFENAVALDPRLTEAYIGIGAVHTSRAAAGWGGYEGLRIAEESFHRALDIDPDRLDALRGLIHVGFTRDNASCLRIARRIRDTGEVSVDALIGQAEGMLLGGLPDEAIPLLRTVRRLDPANQAALFLLAIAHGYAGDFADAIRTGEDYLRSFGEDQEMICWIAGANLCLGNREEARSYYRRARDLSVNDAYSYALAGMTAAIRELDGPESAREVARDGIRQLEARLAEGWRSAMVESDLARLYAIAGDSASVRECGRRLRELDGAWCSSSSAFNLVVAYDEIGDAETANDLLLEQAQRLRGAGAAGDSSGDRGGPYFVTAWLRECQTEGSGSPSLLTHLPAYEEIMAALREEEQRRRSLYGS